MRIYIIGNDGITLCREAPATVQSGRDRHCFEGGIARSATDSELYPVAPALAREAHRNRPAHAVGAGQSSDACRPCLGKLQILVEGAHLASTSLWP
jgi:hypothetical protein